jgi:hypothetical protein
MIDYQKLQQNFSLYLKEYNPDHDFVTADIMGAENEAYCVAYVAKRASNKPLLARYKDEGFTKVPVVEFKSITRVNGAPKVDIIRFRENKQDMLLVMLGRQNDGIMIDPLIVPYSFDTPKKCENYFRFVWGTLPVPDQWQTFEKQVKNRFRNEWQQFPAKVIGAKLF